MKANYVLAAHLVTLVALAIVGCGSESATVPSSYTQYNAKDGTFACDCPDGWSVEGGGGRGPIWATFKSGPAEIRLNGDLAGSLMGDIASNTGFSDGEAPAPELAPVHKVHEAGKEAAEKEYNGYKEVGNIEELDIRLGPARKSQFTASTAFGSGLHGYRVTVLGHDKRVVVFCVCPEDDWKALQPAFDHVLSTLVRGMAE